MKEKGMNKNLYFVLGVIAILLIVIGLKFTSIGSGPAHLIQNDGYNVTGGVLTLLGGFILGTLYKAKTK
jgi:glucose uptake protein GlcU